MATKLDKLGAAVRRQAEELFALRATHTNVLQQIARLVIPRDATFLENVTHGIERTRNVLDSTAPRSVELFSSFMFTLLNNPSLQWFGMATEDDTVNEGDAAKAYFRVVDRVMLTEMTSPASRIYNVLHRMMTSIGAFGMAVNFTTRDEEAGALRFRFYHLADVAGAENEAGFVDTIHRKFRLTPRQAMQKWPDQDLGRAVNDAKGSKIHQPITFMHSVFPADDATARDLVPAKILSRGSPFISVWMNFEDAKVVRVGTFEEFPYQVPRWNTVRNEFEGRGPAHTALPDIRMANRVKETILRGAEKIVDPPLIFPDGGLISQVRLFPGAIMFSEGVVKPEPLIPPGASRVDVGDTILKQAQDAIREAFFVPLFINPDQPVKTATQVLQETDDRNMAVSPMAARVLEELHTPLLIRVFGLLERAGKFPDPPDAVRGRRLQPRFFSPLSSSQKQIEALASLRLFEQLSPWAQVFPDIFDEFNPERLAKVVQEGTGAPDRIRNTKSEVREVKDAKDAQRQQEANQEGILGGVEAIAKLTAAQKNRG